MTRRNILIAVGRHPSRRGGRRRQPLVQAGNRPDGHHRGHQDPRSRGHRVGLGKIQPKRLVNISAETPGRVVDLAVNEGDRIKKGQFLLQIDPKTLRTRVDSGEASLQVAAPRSSRCGSRSKRRACNWNSASRTLEAAAGPLEAQLTTREALEKAENDVQDAPSRRCRSARRQPRRRTAGSCRSGRRSKARATI